MHYSKISVTVYEIKCAIKLTRLRQALENIPIKKKKDRMLLFFLKDFIDIILCISPNN